MLLFSFFHDGEWDIVASFLILSCTLGKSPLLFRELKGKGRKIPSDHTCLVPLCQVEWAVLVEALLGRPVDPATTVVHLYFENELHSAFEEIDFL